jgi:hypothetical protein
MVDSANGNVVASGRVAKYSDEGTVCGLYGSYHVTVYNSCTGSRGVVLNYT